MPSKRGTGRKRPAEDASGESCGAGVGAAVATKESAAARGSATVAGKDAEFSTNMLHSHRPLETPIEEMSEAPEVCHALWIK